MKLKDAKERKYKNEEPHMLWGRGRQWKRKTEIVAFLTLVITWFFSEPTLCNTTIDDRTCLKIYIFSFTIPSPWAIRRQWEPIDNYASHQKAATDPHISLGLRKQLPINYDALFKVRALICFCASSRPFSSEAHRAQESAHSYSSAGHQLCPL
jgi:hypothetical protein